MSGPGKSTGMALSIRIGNMRTKKVPCAPKKYPGKVLFFKQFLCILRAVSLCVCLHKIRRSAANSVIGLRRPPSAVCAEGCVAGMCPYCFILHNIWCSFCPFQAAHGLRTRTKVRTKQFPAKDFGAFVVQKIHACCPENSRYRRKHLVIKRLQACRFYALFAGFCGTRPGSCRNFG